MAVVLTCTMVATITMQALAQTGAQTRTQAPAQAATTAQAERVTASLDRPARAAETVTTEEMMLVIRRLEDRVKELETKLAKTEAASAGMPAPASATNAPSVQAVAESSAKAQDMKAMDMKSKPDDAKTDAAKAQEEKENAGILSFFRKTEITGFVDGYYGYNFNRPPGDSTPLRNFDIKHNQFALNLAELAFEKKPTSDSRIGYRMDLDFGPATDLVHSFEPNGGEETFKHIQQGYLSYLAPVGKGLQIDVGKFVTQHGAEVIETKDNWNYSRSLLFALAIPYYHMGVRASYSPSDKVSFGGFLVNGWNNSVDNNHRKTYGLQAVFKPNAKLTIVENYMGGPEQTDNDHDWRHLYDTTVTYVFNPTVSVMANYDYGHDRVAGSAVHWQGIAAYLRVQANKWLAFAPRFEWYDDHDGFTTGLPQTVKEFTLTSEHKISNGLLTRLEYRRDFSDKLFFGKQFDRLVKAQSTITFGIVYAFSSKGEQ